MAETARARNLRAVPKPAPRAVIYLRQSTHREESISLEMQETSAREHCARHGYHVAAVVADPGISGRKWDKRPGIQKVLKMASAGECDRVIVWRWSRLARRGLYQHLAIDTIERTGAVVESSTEPFDTKTAGGQFGRDVMFAAATFDSNQKGEQWREAHERRRSLGLPAVGGERFGYHWIHGEGEQERYEINPEQADVLAWMYRAYINGSGGPGIARELNRRGILNARGKHWHAKTVRDVLDSGFGAGLLRRVPVDADGMKITEPFSQTVWDEGTHPAVIEPDEWETYKRTRLKRGQQHPRRIAARYTLSGLVQCGDCNAAMTRRDRTGNRERPYVQLICRRSTDSGGVRMVTVSEHRAIEAVKEWLAELADDIGEAAESARYAERLQLTTRATAEEAQRELDRIDKELATLRRHLIAERMTDSEYDQTRAELLIEQQAAAERLALAEQQAAAEESEPAHVVARGLLEEWDTLPVTRRRDLLSRLIRKVRVTPPEQRYGLAGISIIPVWEPETPVVGSTAVGL